MEKRNFEFLGVVAFVILLIVGITIAGPSKGSTKPACRDRLDNDGDRLVDWPNDPGCSSRTDASELNPAIECDDGADNDKDGAIDTRDVGCSGPLDTDETNCGDLICEGGETCSTCASDCGPCDSCADSDGGVVPLIQGTVSGIKNGQPYSNIDTCMSSVNLDEWYCAGNQAFKTSINCATNSTNMSGGCSNGACF